MSKLFIKNCRSRFWSCIIFVRNVLADSIQHFNDQACSCVSDRTSQTPWRWYVRSWQQTLRVVQHASHSHSSRTCTSTWPRLTARSPSSKSTTLSTTYSMMCKFAEECLTVYQMWLGFHGFSCCFFVCCGFLVFCGGRNVSIVFKWNDFQNK